MLGNSIRQKIPVKHESKVFPYAKHCSEAHGQLANLIFEVSRLLGPDKNLKSGKCSFNVKAQLKSIRA